MDGISGRFSFLHRLILLLTFKVWLSLFLLENPLLSGIDPSCFSYFVKMCSSLLEIPDNILNKCIRAHISPLRINGLLLKHAKNVTCRRVLEATTRPFLRIECQFSMWEPLKHGSGVGNGKGRKSVRRHDASGSSEFPSYIFKWLICQLVATSVFSSPSVPGDRLGPPFLTAILTERRRCFQRASWQLWSWTLWLVGCWGGGTGVECAWTSVAVTQRNNKWCHVDVLPA